MIETKDKYGIRATDIYFEKLPSTPMPKQRGDKVVTLNQQGFMRIELDQFSRQWIEEATKSSHPFLEIGAAYGQASVEAVENGALIIANDIEIKHLGVIRNRVNKKYHKNLYLNCGSFPDEVDIPDNSIGGVLCCRVSHFFTTEQMLMSLYKIYEMLVPGGSLFFVSVSPYHYTLRDKFLPIFLDRKESGDNNPGYIDNMKQYMPLPESAEYVPEFLNTFDVDTITKLMKINNFEIIEGRLFDYSKNNSQGKGFTGVWAKKMK